MFTAESQFQAGVTLCILRELMKNTLAMSRLTHRKCVPTFLVMYM